MTGLKRALMGAVFLFSATAADAQGQARDPENTLFMDLKDGRVVIELRPDLAPKHVEQIKTLVRRGFYDNTPFHRVIEGFMAQGGDPTGTGTGGSDLPNIPAEFSNSAKFLRGTVGMARSQSPSAGVLSRRWTWPRSWGCRWSGSPSQPAQRSPWTAGWRTWIGLPVSCAVWWSSRKPGAK